MKEIGELEVTTILKDKWKREAAPVYRVLRKMGYRPLGARHPQKNGPDVFAIREDRAFSIEIKKAEKTQRTSLQVRPVEKNRRNDDFIAIVFPSGYVLFEPMKQHLKCCSPSGKRTITGLR